MVTLFWSTQKGDFFCEHWQKLNYRTRQWYCNINCIATEGFTLVPHRFLCITTSIHKNCHYTLLPVLLAFQPSVHGPMQFSKAASYIIALFAFVLASHYLQHIIYIYEILREANIYSCNSSITNYKNICKTVRLPDIPIRDTLYTWQQTYIKKDSNYFLLKQCKNCLQLKKCTHESILLFPVSHAYVSKERT